MNDKFQQLAADSQIAAVILNNPNTCEFVLVDLALEMPEDISARGLSFVGVMGIVDGAPRTALAVEVNPAALEVIAQAWVQYLTANFFPKPSDTTDDSIQFLERLYALEGPGIAPRL